ncbi:MAG: ROK family protein [Victivallales bacterium]
MSDSLKKSRKLAELKGLILNSCGISRGEVARLADLDIRTASIYLEELCRSGIIKKEQEASSGKGRPGFIYLPNSDQLMFAGVSITRDNLIVCRVDDINNKRLYTGELNCSAESSKLTVFNEIIGEIVKATDLLKDRTLGAIGLSVSRWLQPPMASYDVYSGLSEVLERHAGVRVYRDNLINSRAYQMAAVSGRRNLAIIHPGHVVELGVLKDGKSLTSPFDHEFRLAHLTVDENGPACYCGKKGCLENYVTDKALLEQIKREYELKGIREELPDLHKSSALDNPVIKRIAAQTGKYLAGACEYVADLYQPEIICLMVPDNDLYKKTLKYYRPGNRSPVEIAILPSGLDEVVAGTTAMAAFLSAKQFINTNQTEF